MQGLDKPHMPQDMLLAYLIPIGLEVILNGELRSQWDVLGGKQADSFLTTYHPLLGLTVGLTGMVDKPAQAALQQSL